MMHYVLAFRQMTEEGLQQEEAQPISPTDPVRQLWISSDILAWPASGDGGRRVESTSIRSPYKHWEHAARLAEGDPGELQRIDVIGALKRAVDFRLTRLNENYLFKSLPGVSASKGRLQLLQELGIVRPHMLQRLIEIRNRTEHQDLTPPSAGECRDLVDITWYFLRTTDELVRLVNDGFVLDPTEGFYDTPHAATIAIGPRHLWKATLTGWLPAAYVSLAPIAGWMHVEPQTMDTPAQIVTRLSTKQRSNDFDGALLESTIAEHRLREPSDLWIIGPIKGPPEILCELVKRYFMAT
jgi:hypothetical protein